MAYLINVENNFQMSKRKIRVRHQHWDETLNSHRLNFPGELDRLDSNEARTAAFSIGELDKEGEYLEISVNRHQEELGPCRIHVPSGIPFSFIPGGKEQITTIPSDNGNGTVIKIPAGLPTWKLKIMTPALTDGLSKIMEGGKNITVEDDGPGITADPDFLETGNAYNRPARSI